MAKSSLFQSLRLSDRNDLFNEASKPTNLLPKTLANPLTLADLDQYFPKIPMDTAVLGLCEDGLPVLINFHDNQGGPILVTGDKGCGKTTLLKILVQTALSHDPDQRFLFTAITTSPEAYQDVEKATLKTGQCLGIYDPQDDDGLELHLQQIAGLIEKRTHRKQSGPPLLLVIDDLKFLSRASSQTRFLLESILQNGTEKQVWTAAALQTADCLEMGRWTRYFRTRLIGHMPNTASRKLAIFGGLDSEKLEEKREFAVIACGKWLIFQTPDANLKTNTTIENPQEETEEDSGEYDEDWNAVV
jgi:energy-coupling factor transporter ATP-binding protein EcfA2